MNSRGRRAAPPWLRRLAWLGLVVLTSACGGDDARRAPTPSATATRSATPPPASATATDRPPATHTATATAPLPSPSRTASDTPTPTTSPTLAIPTGTATATVTPTVSARCAGKLGGAGTREVTITSGGVARSFQLTVPESALRGQPVPLLVHYHGVFSTGAEVVAVSGLAAKAAAEGFILAAGNGVGRSWNAGVCCDPAARDNVDDVGFARDLVAAVGDAYCVDPARIYASGFSNGAAMVFRLACEASDLFAAFAPVAGSYAARSCAPTRPRPMQVINNVADPIVPFVLGEASFNAFAAFNRCSAARTTRAPAANATCQRADECADAATTELCSVSGTSHVWPGGLTNPAGPFNATDALWAFFTDQRG